MYLRVPGSPILLGAEGATRIGDLAWNQRGGSPQKWETTMSRKLVRPREGRMIAGVCAGLGRRFGMSAGMVRLLFLLSLLLPGTQVIVYLILWVLMPNEDRYLATR